MKEKEHVGEPILILDIQNTKAGMIKVEIKPEDLLRTRNKQSLIIGRDY